MKRLGTALALAVVVAVLPGAAQAAGSAETGSGAPAALAGRPDSGEAVLTPELLGFGEPTQGFYPYFAGFGGGQFGGGQFGGGFGFPFAGFPGNGGCPSIGYVYCPVLGPSLYWSTFPGASQLGNASSGFLGPFGLGGFGFPGAGGFFLPWR
jgi:hypothetical protein